MTAHAAHSPRPDLTKAHGVHYTPPDLASFLAERMLEHADEADPLVVLDPACGDGELLEQVARLGAKREIVLVGVDRDASAVRAAKTRLRLHNGAVLQAHIGDFLTLAEPNLLELPLQAVDAIITNPPYVRTQAMGSTAARNLAARFGLTGRVDLYQAFVRASASTLRPGGTLALLCSNRFLSIQAGAALRELMNRDFELCEVVDLGDTKLFEAAVLPAIVIARKKPAVAIAKPVFVRIYEKSGAEISEAVAQSSSVVDALRTGRSGLIQTRSRTFEIERGYLDTGKTAAEPWTLTHDERESWLDTIARHTACTFADMGRIRVGIKTTADRVFIRRDWSDLPADQQPEPALLRPLITHHIAARWSASGEPQATILYPHESDSRGKRVPVELDKYPRTRSYLESHRERLEGRKYVIEAGRRWYEVWVAHQPADWSKRKIVFPDISQAPKFFLDETGSAVNGDCYWMALDWSVPPERASLMLGVANSTFAVAFYDAVCGNRLYAGRRRFITQYVRKFPIPDVDASTACRMHELVENLRLGRMPVEERSSVERELDALVWRSFGLEFEEISG